jgi:deoxyadenosine/deoxycytidine kinase
MIRFMSADTPLVGISGQICSGKSTLVKGLAAELDFQALPERPDVNPYLERYYKDPAAWAFQNFLFFLEQSVADQVGALGQPRGAVQERLPEEHLDVFGREFHAQGFLSDEDLALIVRLKEAMTSRLSPPDLLVHLDVDPGTALVRLSGRARDAEVGVSLDYLQALGVRYERFVEQWTLSPVLRIDTQQLDVRQNTDVRRIADLVMEQLSSANSELRAG